MVTINHHHSLIRQIRICSLVVSMLLQGCNKCYNPPGSVVDKQTDNIQLVRSIQSSSKKVRNRKLGSGGPLYQKGNQLQAIKIENLSAEGFPRNQQTEYRYAGKRRFEGVVDHDQKAIKRKKEGVSRGQVTKRKRGKVQENKKELEVQGTEKKPRSENPGKTKKKNKSKKEIRKERKVSMPDSPEAPKSRVKKKRRSVKDEKNDTIIELGIVSFPPEVLEAIFFFFLI